MRADRWCFFRDRFVCRLFLLSFAALAIFPSTLQANPPATLLWDGVHLAQIRQSPDLRNDAICRSLEQLTACADDALSRGPYSVVDKRLVPPSGDKHDYMSFSRYWWPNPDTPNGLPYVRRDGHVNRKLLARGDRNRIGNFYDDVEALALAAYLIDAERYAPHAMLLVKTWFLDSKTRMNPNVNFGQAVPGRADGRGVGIMDTRHFIRVLDAVELLDHLGYLSAADRGALKEWFAKYLQWLLTSDLGIEERSADNNHGLWYAAQTARVALFVEDHEVARQILEEVRDARITSGILPDGSQPKELVRTRSLHYSLFGLSALFTSARLGEHIDFDLWSTDSEGGARLKKGLDYVVPYLPDPDDWPHPEFDGFALSDRGAQVLILAATRWKDTKYLSALREAPDRFNGRHFAPLLFSGQIKASHDTGTGRQPYVVTVDQDFEPPALEVHLPDLSRFTKEEVLRGVPKERSGRVRVAEAQSIALLDEAFRDERGSDLERRQGTSIAKVLVLEHGPLSLDQLVAQLADNELASNEQGIVTLRLPLYVAPGASLIVTGKQTPTLRLSTDRGAFLANAGRLFIVDVLVTSWDDSKGEPTLFKKKTDFRPFLSSYIRSETYVVGSTVQHLGFAAPTAYGFSLSSHPERERSDKSEDWPTGWLIENKFRGLYYGFYSYEARDVAILNNRYIDNIVYGIDPHDRSTRLIIAKNSATGTKERHGIIGSRGISHSYIFDNVAHGNTQSGIMLDRQCVHNVVYRNRVYRNGQGISIYESPTNIIANNLVAFNTKSGVRVRNSIDIEVRNNTVVGHNDYGLEVYSKRLDDHEKRVARGDGYASEVTASFFGNTVKGNRGIAKGSQIDRVRFGSVKRDVDISAVAKQLPAEGVKWNTNDSPKFGSELEILSKDLSRTVDEMRIMVDVSRDGHTGF